MIGGLVARALDPTVLRQLGRGRRTILVTGTNGKSTTTAMLTAAMRTLVDVVSNSDGANMDAGLVSALAASSTAPYAVLEVDELHLPHVSDALRPSVVVLLNLSRDQLDRVGETTRIHGQLRAGLMRHPKIRVVANCDDVLVTSIAADSPNVVWVAAGAAWVHDSVSCPRCGERICWQGPLWSCSGCDFARPDPHWTVDSEQLNAPDGMTIRMRLTLPGVANRGNATLAVAAAVLQGVPIADAVAAVSRVNSVAGRYRTVQVGAHTVQVLMAKNPASWQAALGLVDADAVVVAINGQEADGRDLSWLWDVPFEGLTGRVVMAAGERASDVAVRLVYADVKHTIVGSPLEAITTCPTTRVQVLANYTAFRDLTRDISGARSG